MKVHLKKEEAEALVGQVIAETLLPSRNLQVVGVTWDRFDREVTVELEPKEVTLQVEPPHDGE